MVADPSSICGWHESEMLYKAIQKSNREIVLSLSPGPAHIDRAWQYCRYANMWRITDDFWDNWELLKNMFWRCERWQDHVKEGCFPDCDMLPLGYLGKGFGRERQTSFTRQEQRTMMTLWCLFGSPLMIGAELTKLDDWTKSLLTNRSILKMLTPDCRPEQICLEESRAVWKAENEKTGEYYIALFNLAEEEAEVGISTGEAEMPEKISGELTECWSGEKAEISEGILKALLPAHGCAVYSGNTAMNK